MQNSIQNEQPINQRCSVNQRAMAIVEVETVVIYRFDFDVLVHYLRLWDETEQSQQMHHFVMYDRFPLSIWPKAN